jgi:hypothetical protein
MGEYLAVLVIRLMPFGMAGIRPRGGFSGVIGGMGIGIGAFGDGFLNEDHGDFGLLAVIRE